MVDPESDEDPFEFSQEDLEALVEKYNDKNFIDDLYPLVISQCHLCDQETSWHCPHCDHYVCQDCAPWLDQLDSQPEGEQNDNEDEDVVFCCDVCEARLEMMVY